MIDRISLELFSRHYRGYLTLQRRRRVVNPPAAAAPPPPNDGEQVPRDDEMEGEPVINEGEGNRSETSTTRPTNPIDEPPITATRLFVTAVSTFFSSLIPERPPRA